MFLGLLPMDDHISSSVAVYLDIRLFHSTPFVWKLVPDVTLLAPPPNSMNRYIYKIIKFVAVHKKTRYMSKIAILDNAYLKVQTLCYFILKSDWPNGDKITPV